jgi:hypothetical protein
MVLLSLYVCVCVDKNTSRPLAYVSVSIGSGEGVAWLFTLPKKYQPSCFPKSIGISIGMRMHINRYVCVMQRNAMHRCQYSLLLTLLLLGGIAGGIEICITYPTEYVSATLKICVYGRVFMHVKVHV